MSVFLPKTKFNLYADLKTSEQNILSFWNRINLQQQRNELRIGAQKFVLHDGPPYANGPIHIGHAENKFWKDALNKFFWQSGYDTPYIPGWDSHGLPIENAVEKEFKAQNIDKNSLSRQEFWDKCYQFSHKWMQHQMQQFKNLGVFADYENSYALFHEDESLNIMECIHQFVDAGLLERRLKPVLWSPAEKTALAYAEVEYKDKTSQSVYVLFPVIKTDLPALENARLIVWTTTPWTLPANETVAFSNEHQYVVFENDGIKYCVAEKLLQNLTADFTNMKTLETIKGEKFANTFVNHCLKEFQGQPKQLVHADYVDDIKGTGFVHTAPAHGEDDYETALKYGLNIEDLLDFNGYFKQHVPLVSGKNLKEAEALVLEALQEQNALVKKEEITHSYPHSWRSKAPLIYRLTKQWFLKMKPLKEKALKALEDQNLGWVPKEGKNRLTSMVAVRDDWCVSRQRVWGVPIGIFYNEDTGEILSDPNFLNKTRIKLQEIGVKNWWNLQLHDIDANQDKTKWKRLDDIVEIWFESGSTQYFMLKKKGLLPCDVYLEGSDQHRGWFQSSLLISAFQNGIAPWKTLITHGFCLDGRKQKMSKSLGNVVDPADWSADTLRLFLASSALCYDISMNENSVKNSQEMMFRFRNTIKFLLGITAVTPQRNEIDYQNLPLLEKWLLHKLTELDAQYDEVLKTFQLNSFISALYEFCSQDLSAFYFDIRKDTLYCDALDNPLRQASMHCIHILIPTLLKWLAPITPFFADEAWLCYLEENNMPEQSIHLLERPKLADEYRNQDAFTRLNSVRAARKKITEAIEVLREEKLLTTTSEAAITVPDEMFSDELKSVAIVASVEKGAEFKVAKADGEKCTRCRFVYKHVQDGLCARCMAVVQMNI